MIYMNILLKNIFIVLYLICIDYYLMRSAVYLSSVRVVGPTRAEKHMFASLYSWPPFYSFVTRFVLFNISCLNYYGLF